MVTRLSGLSSGLDIESWVKDLMKVEQTKVDTQYQKKQILEWKRDKYREINTKLLALRTAAFDLKLQGTFQAKAATSSDNAVLTASASTAAVAASYTIKVNSLAAGVTKSSTESLGSGSDKTTLASQFGLSGTVTFTLEGKNGSQDFTFDTAAASINTVMSQINSAGLGIRAVYDANTDRFFLMTTDAGSAAEIHVKADAENFLTGTLKLAVNVGADEANAYKGTDANIDFNDATGLTFASNTVTVAGMTLTLKGTGTATVTVASDVDAAVNKIKAFVEAYNNAVDAMSTELTAAYDRDYQPLTEEQKKEMSDKEIELWEAKAKTGLLRGDSLLKGIYNSLRSIAYTRVEGLTGSYTTLSSVGITTLSYADKGKLYIDENKLRSALAADPEGVMKLFTQSSTVEGEKGLAVKFYDAAYNAIKNISSKAGSSSSSVDNSLLGKDIRQISQRIKEMEKRMADMEERYYKQFSAMEQAIQTFNAQSAWLSSVFSNSSS